MRSIVATTNPTGKRNYPRLQNIALAEHGNTDGSLNIDILADGESYWKFVEAVRRGEVGPVVMHSNLGRLVHGPPCMPSNSTDAANVAAFHVMKASMCESTGGGSI